MKKMCYSKFNDFIRRWNLGPGMNDPRPETISWVRREAEYPPTRFHTEEQRENARGMLALIKEGLYSGFDGKVGDGWIPLLDRLCEDLVGLGWQRKIDQIKEKFGTLRFYVRGGTPEMWDRISLAEQESARTCERCGDPGQLRGRADGYTWIKTLCDSCK